LHSFSKNYYNINLRYDHLAKVLSRILTERPVDAVDIFEDLSKLEKKEKFVNKVDTLIDKPDKSDETKLAEIQRGLYMVKFFFDRNFLMLSFFIFI
jgi:hypothetical protein